MATPTPTPSAKYYIDRIKAETGREITEEQWNSLDPMIRKNIIDAMDKKVATPVPKKTGTPKSAPTLMPTKTPTPTLTKKGKWVIDPETGVKVYESDPAYESIVKAWARSGDLEHGED